MKAAQAPVKKNLVPPSALKKPQAQQKQVNSPAKPVKEQKPPVEQKKRVTLSIPIEGFQNADTQNKDNGIIPNININRKFEENKNPKEQPPQQNNAIQFIQQMQAIQTTMATNRMKFHAPIINTNKVLQEGVYNKFHQFAIAEDIIDEICERGGKILQYYEDLKKQSAGYAAKWSLTASTIYIPLQRQEKMYNDNDIYDDEPILPKRDDRISLQANYKDKDDLYKMEDIRNSITPKSNNFLKVKSRLFAIHALYRASISNIDASQLSNLYHNNSTNLSRRINTIVQTEVPLIELQEEQRKKREESYQDDFLRSRLKKKVEIQKKLTDPKFRTLTTFKRSNTFYNKEYDRSEVTFDSKGKLMRIFQRTIKFPKLDNALNYEVNDIPQEFYQQNMTTTQMKKLKEMFKQQKYKALQRDAMNHSQNQTSNKTLLGQSLNQIKMSKESENNTLNSYGLDSRKFKQLARKSKYIFDKFATISQRTRSLSMDKIIPKQNQYQQSKKYETIQVKGGVRCVIHTDEKDIVLEGGPYIKPVKKVKSPDQQNNRSSSQNTNPSHTQSQQTYTMMDSNLTSSQNQFSKKERAQSVQQSNQENNTINEEKHGVSILFSTQAAEEYRVGKTLTQSRKRQASRDQSAKKVKFQDDQSQEIPDDIVSDFHYTKNFGQKEKKYNTTEEEFSQTSFLPKISSVKDLKMKKRSVDLTHMGQLASSTNYISIVGYQSLKTSKNSLQKSPIKLMPEDLHRQQIGNRKDGVRHKPPLPISKMNNRIQKVNI